MSKNNTIAHNYMINGNLAVGGYAGIYLYESGENTIRNNLIKRYARDAIGLFGSELAFGETQDGVPAPTQSANATNCCKIAGDLTRFDCTGT